jgi:hypothetical protein
MSHHYASALPIENAYISRAPLVPSRLVCDWSTSLVFWCTRTPLSTMVHLVYWCTRTPLLNMVHSLAHELQIPFRCRCNLHPQLQQQSRIYSSVLLTTSRTLGFTRTSTPQSPSFITARDHLVTRPSFTRHENFIPTAGGQERPHCNSLHRIE